MASLVAQTVKRLPKMWETWVRALGWEVPLEKEMAIHSSILAWKIPWTQEPGGLQPMGLQSQTLLSIHSCTIMLMLRENILCYFYFYYIKAL